MSNVPVFLSLYHAALSGGIPSAIAGGLAAALAPALREKPKCKRYAYFHRKHRGGYELSLYAATSETFPQGRTLIATIAVSGKREARKLAADAHATPWNF